MVRVTVEVFKSWSWYREAAKANKLESPIRALSLLNEATGWVWYTSDPSDHITY